MPDETPHFNPPPPQPGPRPAGDPRYTGDPRYAADPRNTGAAGPAYWTPPYAAPAGAYAYPPRRSGWFWAAIFAGTVGALLLLVLLALGLLVRSFGSGSDFSGNGNIAVIDVNGVITNADQIDTQLQRFGSDSQVKAILLHINSPGGGAAASQEIYHEVLRVRQQDHKPVVASVESVGASGAYYIASACNRIYANPASVVGSIGVIMEWTNYGDLLRWAKLKNVTISRGDLKDAGDPTRDMTPQEQAYFQSLVDNMYGQFIGDVAAGRHTTAAKITPLATGQVWTGQQAQPLGLIDQQGGFRMALIDTARSVGISGEPSIVRPPKPRTGLLSLLNGNADSLFPNPSQLLDRSPGFYFLWK